MSNCHKFSIVVAIANINFQEKEANIRGEAEGRAAAVTGSFVHLPPFSPSILWRF